MLLCFFPFPHVHICDSTKHLDSVLQLQLAVTFWINAALNNGTFYNWWHLRFNKIQQREAKKMQSSAWGEGAAPVSLVQSIQALTQRSGQGDELPPIPNQGTRTSAWQPIFPLISLGIVSLWVKGFHSYHHAKGESCCLDIDYNY